MRAFHPLADMFDLLEGQELLDLANDIKERGLHHPILLHPDGSILDGRNRYRACELVGVEARFETWDGKGSALALVISLNLMRRHLSTSQRALMAGKQKEAFHQERLKNQGKRTDLNVPVEIPGGGDARDDAGRAFRVSGTLVDAGEKVVKEGAPELVRAVETGAVSVQDYFSIAARGIRKNRAG